MTPSLYRCFSPQHNLRYVAVGYCSALFEMMYFAISHQNFYSSVLLYRPSAPWMKLDCSSVGIFVWKECTMPNEKAQKCFFFFFLLKVIIEKSQ